MEIKKLNTIAGDLPPFRVRQIREAVYVRLISDWDEATSLSKEMRARLKQELPLLVKGRVQFSAGGKTQKAVIELVDGQQIEAVLMAHRDRNTVCVSSQVGCALGCDFCLTGRMGFSRNLTASEIVDQVLFFARRLKKQDKRVTNVVFMGMGEPFMNYDEVIRAVRIINREMGLAARKISISTVGVIPGIERLAEEPEQVNLAVSLHTADNGLRSRLMPVNRRYSLNMLMESVNDYLRTTGRKVLLEYVMLKDINDSPGHAQELARLVRQNLKGPVTVNLIAYNSTDKYKASSAGTIQKFRNILSREKIETVQRYSFGRDIKGACGQLFG
jgi:23S rRNA (adenine2503-C2)-methyltransferase